MHENKISPQNEKSVMRQVLKLASGEGVRYESKKVCCSAVCKALFHIILDDLSHRSGITQYGWSEGCYFMKGKPVTPMSDIVELLKEAQKCEDKWGEDRGNGWLLRHPLKKLLLFQQFCLTNPAFLKSRYKLAEYCEAAKAMEGGAEYSESSTGISKSKFALWKQGNGSCSNDHRSEP